MQRRRKRRATLRRGLVFAGLAAVIILIVVLIQSGGKPKKVVSPAATSTSTTVASTTTTTVKAGTTPCPPASGSKTRKLLFNGPPKDCITPTSVWDATFHTTKGTFVVRMDAAKSYAAVNNFVFLALYRYYDGTFFHRVIPGFMDQGGDPAGTGTGGPQHYPGYAFTGNTPPKSCIAKKDCYATGDIAMANTGAPTSNGSQFFIFVPGGASQLDPNPVYTDFGHVISGLPVVEHINALGTSGQTGTPKVKVFITSITMKKVSG